MLKKALFCLLLILLLFITACTVENDPQETGQTPPPPQEEAANIPHFDEMLGAWSGKYSGANTDSKITFALREDCTGYIITDGYIRTFVFSYENGEISLEYDAEGTMLPINAECRFDKSRNVLLDFGTKTLLLSDRQPEYMTDGLRQVAVLVGTWSGIDTGSQRITYIFNADGSGEYYVLGKKNAEEITWSASDNILVVGRGVSAVMFEYEESDGMLSLLSSAASGAMLYKRVSIIGGMNTDKRLFGTWKLSKVRTFVDGDTESYSEAIFVNDYRMIFSSDGKAFETRDGAEIYRYDYGIIPGGEAELPSGTISVLPELFVERTVSGVIYRSYSVYDIVDGELIIYNEDGASVYTYFDDSETAIVDFGIPSRLVGTWLGSLEMEGVSGTILITLNDDGTGRIVLDSDADMDFTVSADTIAIIYSNENRGYIFSLDINDEDVKISYRNGSVVYSLKKVTENNGIWKKFTVDDRLYGSWGSGNVKYVFDSDGTGYLTIGDYKYNLNYMAADSTIIFNVMRSSSLLTTVKYSYSIENDVLTLEGVEYSRTGAGDVAV